MATRWVMRSGVHLVDFLGRVSVQYERHDDWKARGVYQAWTFADGSVIQDTGEGLKVSR
jgi:hypothetical protein